MKLPSTLLLACALLATAAACDPVDYIDLEPSVVLLRNRKDGTWLSAKAMSNTRVHYPNEKVYWSVKDPSIAQVDEKGRVTPVKSGNTEVIATHRKVSAFVPVQVRFAEKMTVTPTTLALAEGGPSVELQVKVYDFEGRELKDRTATFTSKNKEVVSMGQNAAFPVNAGQAEVEVHVEELKQRVVVTVAPQKGSAKTTRR